MPDLVKIQIVPLGDWLGHSSGEQHYGQEEALAMVERANRIVKDSGNPLQIDYEHASLDPPASGAPAAGWMYSFTLENDGIYADVEWTPKAKEYIKNGEYKYISPVIATGLPDPVTGETVTIELFNAALTNQPFMHDSIKQVMANKMKDGAGWFTNASKITDSYKINGGMSMDIAQKFAELKAVLGIPETAGPEEVIGLVKKMAELMAALPGAPGEGMPTAEQMPEMETEMKQAVMNSKILNSVATFLAVDPDKVLPTITAMSNKTAGVDETKTKLAEMESKLKERDIADLLTANTAKIPPAKREFWANYAKTNGVEATKTVLDEMPEVLPGPPNKTTDDEKIDSERIALANRMGLTPDDIKTFSRNKEAK